MTVPHVSVPQVAPHVTVCQVRWIDIDAYRHVNNTAYLRYLEQARIEMMSFLAGIPEGPPRGADAQDSDGLVIAELEVAYRRPITFRPEPLEVHSWVTHLGRTSWATRQRIVDAGPDPVEYATGTSRLVAIDRVSARPRPLRDYEREYLGQFLEVSA
jgi:acyl-CoA thioester hydrolase